MDSIFNDNFMSTWIADKIEESQRVSLTKRSERALRKTRILAMEN